MEHGRWQSSAELKLSFRSVSILTSERVVFNIKGNDYRLVAALDYKHQIVLIKWLGTHAEYDEIDSKTVMFQKERYDDSRHSN